MSTIDQTLGAWSGPAFAILLGIGFLTAGFIPLPAPSLDPGKVVEIYQSRPELIRLGMLIAITSAVFVIPFAAAISTQMRRMQGVSRMPADLQLGAGAAGAILLLMPALVLAIATFRPERDPQITALLHDVGWLLFITPFPLAMAQNLGIALGTLLDKSSQPVFPRWVAYFNIWVALLFLPGGLAFFFKTGPFAWNGLLAFWVAASAFFVWVFVMTFVLLKAIRQSASGL